MRRRCSSNMDKGTSDLFHYMTTVLFVGILAVALAGFVTYMFRMHSISVLTENELDCVERKGEYTLRLRPDGSVKDERCSSEEVKKYNL